MTTPKKKNINLSASLKDVLNFADPDLSNEAFKKALIEEIASGYTFEPDGVDGGSRTREVYRRIEKAVRETTKEFRDLDDYFARNNFITAVFNNASQELPGLEAKINPESSFLEGSSYLIERIKKHTNKTP